MTAPATDAERPTKGPARASGERAAWSPPREAWLPICGVSLLFAGHWF